MAFIVSFYVTERTYVKYYRQEYDLWIGCVAPSVSVETLLAAGQLLLRSTGVATVEPVRKMQTG